MVTWIIRILLVLFLIRLVMRAIHRLTGAQQPRRGRAPQPIERAGGALVRDPQCGTYIPESNAMTLRSGGETKFFCSAACRDTWVGARRGQDVKAG